MFTVTYNADEYFGQWTVSVPTPPYVGQYVYRIDQEFPDCLRIFEVMSVSPVFGANGSFFYISADLVYVGTDVREFS